MSYLDNFYYRLMGSAGSPRIVFLHGLMGFSSNWQRIARSLESDYEILIYDQRGHGRSFQPESGYAPKDFAGDLYRIMEALNWKKTSIVGHSMGGRAALSFANSHPERVERLVIEDIGAEPSWDSMQDLRRMILSLPVPFPDRNAARQYFETQFHKEYGESFETQSLGPYLLANLKTLENGSMTWRFSLKGVMESLELGRSQDLWREWEGLKVSTLLVRGRDSKMLKAEEYEEMLRRQKHSEGVEILAGHWVHSERPDEFIQVLRDFLSKG